MNLAYLLTGGNIGNRSNNLDAAKKMIGARCGSIIKQSAVYETAAWGITEQPSFYNQVLEIETKSSPIELLHELLNIESLMGRKRLEKYGPRIIDLDILLMNDIVLNSTELTLPHPRINERRFVLAPLAEIAPTLIHPVEKKTISQLLLTCNDELNVHKISAQQEDK